MRSASHRRRSVAQHLSAHLRSTVWTISCRSSRSCQVRGSKMWSSAETATLAFSTNDRSAPGRGTARGRMPPDAPVFDQVQVRLLPVHQPQRQLAGGAVVAGGALGRVRVGPALPRGRARRAVDPDVGHGVRVEREVGVRLEVAVVGHGGNHQPPAQKVLVGPHRHLERHGILRLQPFLLQVLAKLVHVVGAAGRRC